MSAFAVLWTLLIFALFVILAVWIIDLVAGALKLPPQGVQIVKAILLIMGLLWLLQGFAHPFGPWYFR